MTMANDNRHRTRHKASGLESGLGVLFLAAMPLALWLFTGSPVTILFATVLFGLLGLALRLISTGQSVARAYDAARIAARPRLPRKLTGSALIGLVVFLLAGNQVHSLAVPMICGLVAFGLSVAAFGIDPVQDKGHDDPNEQARLNRQTLLTEVEATLTKTKSRVHAFGDTQLSQRTTVSVDLVLSLARASAQDAAQFDKLTRTITKFGDILTSEVQRLDDSKDSETYAFARRRFLAKLKVLTESFEEIAWKKGIHAGRDPFDMEADLLLDRMRLDPAV